MASTAETLQAVQALSQLSNAAGSLGNAVGVNPADLRNTFRSVDQVTADPNRAAEDDHDHAHAVGAPDKHLVTLRMCIHSAKGIIAAPVGSLYAVVRINEAQGPGKEFTHKTGLVANSSIPAWEHCFDQELDVSIVSPKAEVAVYNKVPYLNAAIGEQCLGACAIPLEPGLTDGPLKQELSLHTTFPFSHFSPTGPTILVVWQVCEKGEFVPDLNRVAEMADTALEKEPHKVALKLLNLNLRRPTRQMGVSVQFRIRKPLVTQVALPSKNAPVVRTWPRGHVQEEKGKKTGEVPSDLQCSEAVWFSDQKDARGHQIIGWACNPWMITESRVALLSHILEVTVYTSVVAGRDGAGTGSKKQIKLGSWREPIGDLMDCIFSVDRIFRFDATIKTQDGQTLATLRMEIDIFTEQGHRPLPAMSVEASERDYKDLQSKKGANRVDKETQQTAVTSEGKAQAPVQVRNGLPNQEIWQSTRMYYCTVFVDGLPCLEQCADPVVRVTMGAFSAETDKATRIGQFNNVRWTAPVMVTSKVISRRAKIELLVGPKQEVLGEQTVYDAAVGKLYWMHLFGGATEAPKKELAQQMVKQTVRPPSTYQGTVVVYFGTARQPTSFFQGLIAERKPCRLVVRLYSGIYIHSLAKKRVRVLIQVAGCRLPDEEEAQRSMMPRASGGDSKGRPNALNGSGPGKKAAFGQPDPRHYNVNVLSFAGYVDMGGVLRFENEMEKTGEASGGRSVIPFRGSRKQATAENRPPQEWVERRTPREFPLLVPPSVTHAYIYLVVEGEEAEPPTIFGRCRLGDEEPARSSPHWKKLRFDPSVTVDEPAHFPHNLAGFILASASLSNWEGPSGPAGVANRAATSSVSAPDPQTSEGRRPSSKDASVLSTLLPTNIRAPLCTPLQKCTPTHFLAVGSPGATGDICSVPVGKLRRVYCHVDVLAARNLPAMDEDGLAECCYRVQMMGTTLSMPGGSTKSLSPSFMHRVTIPFDAVVSEHPTLPDCLTNPLPPVVFKMCDRDDRKIFGSTVGTHYEVVGVVVCKHAPMVKEGHSVFPLLGCYRQGGLSLNQQHTARWYALDKPARTAFAADSGLEGSWQHRPRVLMALGYSFYDEPPEMKGGPVTFEGTGGTICMLQTQESVKININIDLLGLRNLPEDVFSAKLSVTSFWEGRSADFDIGSGMMGRTSNLDPNFPQDGWEHRVTQDTEWMNFWSHMKPFVSLVSEGSNLQLSQTEPDEDEAVPIVQTDDLLGIRVKAPTYEVPVIPYLQAALGKLDQDGQPFLLLPAISFQLRNFMTLQEYGGFTVGLNSLPLKDHDFKVGGWAEYCVEEFMKLPAELTHWSTPNNPQRKGRIGMLDNMSHQEGAYECFVDIFACETGEITWDHDFHIGRCLRSPSLFSLTRHHDLRKVSQYFNPADWLSTDPLFKVEPFDERVVPSLWLGDKPGSRSASPLGPTELYRDFLYHSQRDPAYLKTLNTAELKRCLGEEGFRAPSHQVAPECVNVHGYTSSKVKSARSNNLEYNNTHTFMRKVGHIIHQDDRDSRLLCRLRLGLPLGHIGGLQQRLKEAREALNMAKRSEDPEEFIEQCKAKVQACQQALFAAEEVERIHAATNFLVIRFKKPGMVVWTAPDEVNVWDRPGSLLMAVRMQDDSNVIVPVFVPNFDLRFQFETGWYPRKTLKTRFGTMEAQMLKKNPEEVKKKVSVAPPGAPIRAKVFRGPGGFASVALSKKQKKPLLEDENLEHGSVTNLSGYDRPIFASKGAFICRIRQRDYGVYYDRPQTKSWAHAVLQEHLTLPEDPNPDLIDAIYMEQSLAEFMNLRQPLVTGVKAGSDHKHEAFLKGNIHVQRCRPGLPITKEVDMHQRPLSNLWIRGTVFIGITVLSIHNLDLTRLGRGKLLGLKPYLKVSLGTEQKVTQTVEVSAADMRVSQVNLYKNFQFEVILPGRTQLAIEVWHQGLLSDTLLGKTLVDLEDRWMVLKWRDFRDSTNGEYLKRTISPKRMAYCSPSPTLNRSVPETNAGGYSWVEPIEPEYTSLEDGGIEVKPCRAPEERMPIEAVDLLCEDEDTAHEEKAGLMRMLLEMTPKAPEEPYSFVGHDLVVVVTIWEVSNIQFFKDWGERNDAYIEGRFRATDYWGRESHELKFTDTHKFARYKAAFNWRWVFTVRAPAAECSLQLTMLDADRISSNDPIYDAKVYPMDQMLRVACERAGQGKASMGLGPLAETVVFDRWPEVEHKPRCGVRCTKFLDKCCGKRRRRRQEMALFAKLRMDVEVLTKAEADLKPPIEGQVSPPQGRLSLSSAVTDASGTASIILGPTVWRNLVISSVLGGIFMIFLMVIILLYYILSVVALA